MANRRLLSSLGPGVTLAIGGVAALVIVSALLAFHGWPGVAPQERTSQIRLATPEPVIRDVTRKLVLGRALVRGDAATAARPAAARRRRRAARRAPEQPRATPAPALQQVAEAPPIAAPAAVAPAPAPAVATDTPAVQDALEGVVESVEPALDPGVPPKPLPVAVEETADAVGGAIDGLLKP